MAKISIVIITFNSKFFIRECLDSLFSQGGVQDFEVIVVDNGSSDGTPGLLKANYPRAVLIENNLNLGACKARNQGIERSKGEWVLTLDCDVILEKDFLKSAVEFLGLSDNPSLGMLQPKVLFEDGKTIYSCGIFLSWLRRFHDLGKGRKDSAKFNNPKSIFGTCSAAAFYRRKMLEEIRESTGYFDERFLFLVEDVDLSWRGQRKGWKAVYYPQSKCFHCGNSSKTEKKLRQYLCLRNRWFMLKKNEGVISILIRMPFYLIYDFPRLLMVLFNYKGRPPSLTNNFNASR